MAKAEHAGGESSAHHGTEVSESAVNKAPILPMPTRVDLLRGVGAPAGTFSDEVLAQIGKVSAVDDDMLRLMQAGRAPTPLLADTVDRFRIDQEVSRLIDPSGTPAELFSARYQALQKSEHEWVRFFQRQYPDLPKAAVEQMLDRYGIDLRVLPDTAQARQVFRQLDSKARQYQQHVRLNRAYEGLYLRSIANPESDTLALHSLKNLPGWPKGLRIEIHDGSPGAQVLDRIGPLDTPDCRVVIKSGAHYLSNDAATTNFYEAVVEVLSTDERSALGLISGDPANELKLKIADRTLSRSELVVGLARMDSRLPFDPQGLRGGGFPDTHQDGAFTHEVKRLQIREIYPELSNEHADAMLQQLGNGLEAHIDRSKQLLQQLCTELDTWIDEVGLDIDDMDVPFLEPGTPQAQGFTFEQLALRNVQILEDTIKYERDTRGELADELIAIWQKRAPQHDSHYSGDHVGGFTMNMSHEDYHRLPMLNVRFNDVVGLNLNNVHLFERQTLNGFLDCFPNLRTLNLQDTDLRVPNLAGELESVLPATIPQLQHLTTLNLRSTRLTLREQTAGQLSQLVNLQSLDMSDNPLGVPPVVLGMNQLRSLRLNDTGITTCPVGIMDQPYLTALDLSNNQIRRVPQAVLNQAIARDRVLLRGNPLTDEDTLQRLIRHREQTGINLWLNSPGVSYSDPAVWLRDIAADQQEARLQIWHRLALKRSGLRFLGTINALTLTPDFLVGYLDLQARVWQLLNAADASVELWERLVQVVPRALASADNPFVVFTAMEDRASLYANWVAVGQPFPVGENQPL
nr:leucine-rich repeat domain-containing protein [Pseudomonas sp. PCH199]